MITKDEIESTYDRDYFSDDSLCFVEKYKTEKVLNDPQIKSLLKIMNDLSSIQSPKYILKPNGEFESIRDEVYNKQLEVLAEQIEYRKSQIISAYNFR